MLSSHHSFHPEIFLHTENLKKLCIETSYIYHLASIINIFAIFTLSHIHQSIFFYAFKNNLQKSVPFTSENFSMHIIS